MNRWKILLILILAVILLHILIIKIFIIGNSDEQKLSGIKTENVSPAPEPPLPPAWRK